MKPVLLVAMLAAAVVSAEGPKEPVTIYVGPTTKHGFVDTENNVLESVRHIQEELRKELRKDPGFRVVSEESGANVKLFVKRSVGFSSGGYAGSVTGSGSTTTARVYESVSQYGMLDAELRVGEHQQRFRASVEGWKKLAKQISKEVAVWLQANRERIP